MEKVLVTGGAGFIGSNLCKYLSEEYEVTAFDDLSLGKKENLTPEVKFVKGDVKNKKDLEKLPEKYDYIVHLAGASCTFMFQESLTWAMRTNIVGFINVLDYARETGVRKVLFASTSSIYGDNPTPFTEDQKVIPPNFYSVSKLAMEHLANVYNREYGTEIIAFRFMSVYGPGEEHKTRYANLVSQFIWNIITSKKPVVYGDGLQERDLTNVSDVAAAVKMAIETKKKYGFTVFNIGAAKQYNLLQIIEKINQHLGKNIKPEHIKSPLKWTARRHLGDLSKIKKELGYRPSYTLEQGIDEIIKNLQDRPKSSIPDV